MIEGRYKTMSALGKLFIDKLSKTKRGRDYLLNDLPKKKDNKKEVK